MEDLIQKDKNHTIAKGIEEALDDDAEMMHITKKDLQEYIRSEMKKGINIELKKAVQKNFRGGFHNLPNQHQQWRKWKKCFSQKNESTTNSTETHQFSTNSTKQSLLSKKHQQPLFSTGMPQLPLPTSSNVQQQQRKRQICRKRIRQRQKPRKRTRKGQRQRQRQR